MEQGHRQEFLLCTLLKGIVRAQTYHADPLEGRNQPCLHSSPQLLVINHTHQTVFTPHTHNWKNQLGGKVCVCTDTENFSHQNPKLPGHTLASPPPPSVASLSKLLPVPSSCFSRCSASSPPSSIGERARIKAQLPPHHQPP